MKPNIELHIEELVLHGFEPRQRHRIAQAMERELSRLLVEDSVPASLADGVQMARLDGGGFEVAVGSTPEVIGAQTARAVYGGFRR